MAAKQRRAARRPHGIWCALIAAGLVAATADARVTKIQITSKESPTYGGASFGTGSDPVLWWEDYADKMRGRATAGMLDRCRVFARALGFAD